LKEQISALYGEYGRYINKYRSFPLIYDGLKIVERRLLYSLYERAKDHLVKSAEVVGWTIGQYHPHGDCLKSDTKIPLLNGDIKTIKDICIEYQDKHFWVYSCDPNTGMIVAGKAHSARIGQRTKTMYRVLLDNGKIVETTSNHPFMLRDCTYVKAENLKTGMSLMPFHQSINNGYMLCSNGSYGVSYAYKYTGNKFIESKRMSYISQNGSIPENHVIHHKDFNKLNDNPDNLLSCSRKEHVTIHQLNDLNFINSSLNSLSNGRDKMFNSDDIVLREKIRKKNSDILHKVNPDLPLIKAIRLVRDMITEGINLTEDNYNLFRKNGKYYNYPLISNMISRGYISSFEDLVSKARSNNNHIIIKIDKVILEEEEDFYDITVDTYHNFAIDQGIFVHNSSAYGSLASLVNGKLADGHGNWGCTAGIVPCDPAAMRYTEVKANKAVLDLAFEYIKYVKLEPLELKDEPIFLPTKLPFCLLNKSMCQGIGFGSRTVIPNYETKDLVKRLKWLLGYEKKEPIIRPLTDCTFISKDKDFQELLTTGKAKIEYRGITEIDYAGKGVVVKSIPPSKSFNKILKSLENDIEITKTIGFIDESTVHTRVKFLSLKRSLTLDQLQKKINTHLVGSITFECNMCDEDGNVVLVSVDQMLKNVYNNYIKIVEAVLNANMVRIQKEIDELILITKIKVVLPKWLREFPDDPDRVVNGIASDTQIASEVVGQLFDKYTMSRILKIRTDITSLEIKKQENQTNLNNLAPYVWSDKYQNLLV